MYSLENSWKYVKKKVQSYKGFIYNKNLSTYYLHSNKAFTGFPGSSVGKESACNAGDPGVIPGLGKSPGEGMGYPLQYSWASLVAQKLKNPPAV